MQSSQDQHPKITIVHPRVLPARLRKRPFLHDPKQRNLLSCNAMQTILDQKVDVRQLLISRRDDMLSLQELLPRSTDPSFSYFADYARGEHSQCFICVLSLCSLD